MKMRVNYYNGADGIISSNIINELKQIFDENDVKLVKYSIARYKENILLELKKVGWSDAVRLDRSSKITISSIKNNIGMCFQTGNVGRMYADLLKLQTMFSRSSIYVGIVILPTNAEAKAFGGNVASFERLDRELEIFKDVINMPLVVMGFYE